MSSEEVWVSEENMVVGVTLEQGDLLRFSREAPFKYGVVVTADCDLDKKKHSKIVTYVPLISFADAIRESLIHDLISRRDAECKKIIKKHFKLDPDLPLSLEIQMLAILKEKALLNGAPLPENIEPPCLLALLTYGRCQLPTLEHCKKAMDLLKISWENALDIFSSQLVSRGDFLRLTRPPLAVDNVVIAWLRGVSQCNITSVALKTSEEMDDGKISLKIGKLRSPYIYRLTQMLGQVFSDIGLPDLPKIAFDGGE